MQKSKVFFKHLTAIFACCLWLALGGGQRVLGQQQQPELTNNFHSAILCTDGTVQTVGYNSFGQLGIGSTTPATTNLFATVPELTDVQQVSVGGHHNLALKCDGTVWAWGLNDHGQVGVGSGSYTINSPTQVPGITNAIAVSAGRDQSMVLLADGTVRTWGDGAYGQLGNGTTTNSNVPVTVSGLSNVIAIEAGGSHCMALLADGTVRTWGYNYFGALGNATNNNSSIPVSVVGLSNVVQIAAAESHCLAVLSNGTAWAWGYNWYGQLGNGTTTHSNIPVNMLGLSNVADIDGGDRFSIVLLTDGTIMVCGESYHGQFGICSPNNSSIPIVGANLTNVVDLQAYPTASHVIVILADGTIRTWGYNNSGQLGIGNNSSQCTPQTPTNVCAAAVPNYCQCSNTPEQDLACCLLNTAFANAPNTPVDDRPAYVVTNSATWTLANNPFVNLYGWTPNTPVALNVDLVIPYGVTLQLQGMQFNFAPQCRVLVQRGGVLIADVGEVSTITSFTGICNTMWQGIQIEGDTNSHRHITPSINYGVAQLRGNVFIDDALVAIACQRIPLMPVNTLFTALAASPTNFQNINNSVGAELFYTQYFNLGGAYYGGVCQISKQTVIRNSFVGVLLNRYHWNNDLPSCSMEGAAVFSTTGLKYPFTALPYSYNTETGVLLNDYWHMCVGPCTAEATVLDGNLFANNKIALRAIASTYNRFFENTVGQSRIGVSVTNTAISGFAFDLNVRLNQFQETERGIQADGSLINIRQNNLFNTTTPTNSIGVFLNGCDFDVRENDFTNFTFGNILNQNNTEPSRVLNNIFTNTTTGVWAVGNNGNIADGGTQIQCNQFNNHLSTAIRVANAIVPPTPGTMDNQGDCSFNNGTPADNTFTDTAPTDLHSMINPASFVYYYRTTNPIFLPASTAAPGFQVINTVGCAGVISSSNEHCNYIAPIPEGLVLSLTDTKQKNAKGSDLRYQYLDGQEDPTAAKNLFEAMDTRYTQSRLIPYYLGQGDFETALNLLTNLPNTDEYADLKTLYTLYYNLNSHGKTLWDINPTEEALLRQLADSPSKTSFNARAALLMLYGEEYSITLPALDNTTEPFNIGFKTNSADEQQPWVTLSPNPAKDAVQIQHHLADNQTGKFCLYSPDGQLLHSATLVGNGNYVLSTQNMASGVYFYTLEQNGQTLQRNKIVLIK